MLGLPMVYITHIISISSIFETLGANGSKNTCPILASIEYLRVFVLVLTANTNMNTSMGFPVTENIRIHEYILVPYLELGQAGQWTLLQIIYQVY